jgi:uroporphyrinogen decarboxylase
MNSRERILKTLNHEEPDRIPYDLAGTTWTGITNCAYQKWRKYLGLEDIEPDWSDVIQQIVIPDEDFLNRFLVDVRGLFPLTSHNWDVWSKVRDKGKYLEYSDEWGFVHHFPKDGHWFSLVESPMEHTDFEENGIINAYQWPAAGDKARLAGLRENAISFRNRDKIVFIKGLCAGLFEMHQRVRGVANAMTDPFIYPANSDLLIGKIADLKIEFWESALAELNGLVDIVGEGDDYGTQQSQLISPEHFREYYKPHFKRVLNYIKQKAPEVKLMFHSCGNVRPVIPDLIEIGVDILNPVHINSSGMEPTQLKKDFGDSVVFWGGGVDTQKILPSGTVKEVADDVKRNIGALAPGGGFVFCTVHNIQSEVPPENIMAMWNTLQEFGKY